MTDWTKAYQALAKAGYSDKEIEEISGVTRSTVCNVRNGTWPHKHDPGHAGGQAVLMAIEAAVVEGTLESNPLED